MRKFLSILAIFIACGCGSHGSSSLLKELSDSIDPSGYGGADYSALTEMWESEDAILNDPSIDEDVKVSLIYHFRREKNKSDSISNTSSRP